MILQQTLGRIVVIIDVEKYSKALSTANGKLQFKNKKDTKIVRFEKWEMMLSDNNATKGFILFNYNNIDGIILYVPRAWRQETGLHEVCDELAVCISGALQSVGMRTIKKMSLFHEKS